MKKYIINKLFFKFVRNRLKDMLIYRGRQEISGKELDAMTRLFLDI